MTVSAVQIQNLLYVVGALVVATLVSGFIVLRHRKPKSLEAGIESFSRELKALAPERRPPPTRDPRSASDGGPPQRRRGLRPRPIAHSGASRVGRHSTASTAGSRAATSPGSNGAAAEPGTVDDSGRHEKGDEGLTHNDSSARSAPRPVEGAHFHALDDQETDGGDQSGRRQGG
jgi:hypothetical protein